MTDICEKLVNKNVEKMVDKMWKETVEKMEMWNKTTEEDDIFSQNSKKVLDVSIFVGIR